MGAWGCGDTKYYFALRISAYQGLTPARGGLEKFHLLGLQDNDMQCKGLRDQEGVTGVVIGLLLDGQTTGGWPSSRGHPPGFARLDT